MPELNPWAEAKCPSHWVPHTALRSSHWMSPEESPGREASPPGEGAARDQPGRSDLCPRHPAALCTQGTPRPGAPQAPGSQREQRRSGMAGHLPWCFSRLTRCNKIPTMDCSFPSLQEAIHLRSKPMLSSWRVLFLAERDRSSLPSLGGKQVLVSSSSYMGTNPIQGLLHMTSSEPDSLPTDLLQIPPHWCLGFDM